MGYPPVGGADGSPGSCDCIIFAITTRIFSLISEISGAVEGNDFAIARNPLTTAIAICVPCCMVGEGVGGAGDAAVGSVGAGGGDCPGPAFGPAPGGGGSEDAAEANRYALLCACFAPLDLEVSA